MQSICIIQEFLSSTWKIIKLQPRPNQTQLPDEHSDPLKQVQEEGGQEVPGGGPERDVHPQQGDGHGQVCGTHRLCHGAMGWAGVEEAIR